MDALTKYEFSFKNPFVSLTTAKAIILIIIVGFVVYGNMLFNGFVWDDISYIVQNPDFHSQTLWQLFGPNLFNYPPFYRPFGAVFFSLLYSLFANSAFFYHLLQMLLHIVNSSLIYILFKRHLKNDLSMFLSLLFLVHPMQVESVAFISQTINPLTLLFGLIGLLLTTRKKLKYGSLLLIFLFLNISLYIKEVGVIFFILVLLYKSFFAYKKKDVIVIALLSILSGSIYLYMRLVIVGISFGSDRGGVIPIVGLSLSERLVNIPAIIFYYLKTFVFPLNLAINQQWVIKSADIYNFYIPLLLELLIIFLLIAFGIHLYKNNKQVFKVFIFFAIWLLLGFIPIIQIIPIDMTVADRFLYFSLIGIIGIFGVIIHKTIHEHRRFVYIILISLLVLFSIRTMARNTNWYNNLTLYSHDIQIAESSAIATNLANEYRNLNKYSEALVHYKKAAAISEDEGTMSNLGYIYEILGDAKRAEGYYMKSLSLNKLLNAEHRSVVLANVVRLAIFYVNTKQYEKAKMFAEAKLKEFPKSGVLWQCLAVSYYNLGNQSKAIYAVENAKTFLPNDDEIKKLYLLIRNKSNMSID